MSQNISEEQHELVQIRPAKPGDGRGIFELIHELAVYEKLEDQVIGTADALEGHLFNEPIACEALVAIKGDVVIAYALFFGTYSTFRTQAGIYLEDLYVTPNYRNQGIGKRLLSALAAIALARNCGRLEWSVLDWNKSAIDFYVALGAEPLDEWTMYRIFDQPLRDLAAMHG